MGGGGEGGRGEREGEGGVRSARSTFCFGFVFFFLGRTFVDVRLYRSEDSGEMSVTAAALTLVFFL